MATVSLAEDICKIMNETKDKCLRFVYECALAQICVECHINYELNKYLDSNNGYGEYRLTTGILYEMPKKFVKAMS